jgi:hypothetical protein
MLKLLLIGLTLEHSRPEPLDATTAVFAERHNRPEQPASSYG